MNYLYLNLPYSDFEDQIQNYKVKLSELKEGFEFANILEGNYNAAVTEINSYLKSSFNIENNFVWLFFLNSKHNGYVLPNSLNSDPSKKIFLKIDAKIFALDYLLILIKNSDLIKEKNDELFSKRQGLTLKQKRDLIMHRLYKLNSSYYYNLKFIYDLNGLKISVDNEIFDIAQKLNDNGLVDYNGGTGGDCQIQITTEGFEYIEELDESAFGLYSVGEELTDKERIDLEAALKDLKTELISEIQNQFKNQKEQIDIAMNSLFEVIDESLVAIDSKLPKKGIRRMINGIIYEKTIEKGMTGLAALIWKALGDKIFLPDALSKINKIIVE